jgi:hypothetical protein
MDEFVLPIRRGGEAYRVNPCCNPSKSSPAAQIFSPDYCRSFRRSNAGSPALPENAEDLELALPTNSSPKEKVRAEARRREELKGAI